MKFINKINLPLDRIPRTDCLWHHGMDKESRLIQHNPNKPRRVGSLPFYCTAKTAHQQRRKHNSRHHKDFEERKKNEDDESLYG
jgi:hypothetical protein